MGGLDDEKLGINLPFSTGIPIGMVLESCQRLAGGDPWHLLEPIPSFRYCFLIS